MRAALPSIAAVLALSLASARAFSEAPAWDLARWAKEAEARSPALVEAKENVAVRAARAMEDAWGRFPSLRWESTIVPVPSLEGDPFVTQTPVTQFVGFGGVFQTHRLDISWPLFTFGRLRATARAAKADERAAGHDLAREHLALRIQVERAYDAAKLSTSLRRIVAEGRKRLLEADRKLEELLEAGAQEVDELDKNRFATLLADLSGQLADHTRAEAAALAELRTAAGLPEIEAATIDPAPLSLRPLRALGPDTLVRGAPGSRDDLRATAARVEQKRGMRDAAVAAYWPELFATGTLGVSRCNACTDQRNPFATDFLNLDLWSLSLGLRLGLDYGPRVARARQAEAELRKADALRGRAALETQRETREAWHRYEEARARIAIAQKGLESAVDWYQKVAPDFLAGKARAADYAEALNTWLRFAQDLARGIQAANWAASQLELAAGVDLRAR